jgi:3-hydroxybutyryl-CoA dehydrogenase
MSINKIGIAGAGTMGRGIALCAITNGFKVIMYDINQEILDNSSIAVRKGIDKLVTKGRLDEAEAERLFSNLEVSVNIESMSDADYVIEASVEDLEIKRKLFSELDSLVSDNVILATNTSSLSVTAISRAVKEPSRVCGMHFFNPADIMKLVEIVKGEFTSSDTIGLSVSLAQKLGKTHVICKDTPAFIVNRIARPFYGESLKILAEENLPVELIDNIIRSEGGFKMGPFELMDLIGIDVNFAVTRSVYNAFFQDEKYRPNPIQQKMVDSGLLGRKTGQGFYKY